MRPVKIHYDGGQQKLLIVGPGIIQLQHDLKDSKIMLRLTVWPCLQDTSLPEILY